MHDNILVLFSLQKKKEKKKLTTLTQKLVQSEIIIDFLYIYIYIILSRRRIIEMDKMILIISEINGTNSNKYVL